MKNRIIFLDIDGVLNSQDWFCSDDPNRGKGNFDPIAINRLNWVIEETDAKIVLSTSWRNDPKIFDTFKQVGVNGEISGKTDYFATGINYLYRGNEILKWCNEHDDKIISYVIIDDDEDMLFTQKDNFVHTDYIHGFTEMDARKAIKILLNTKY